MDYYTNHYSEGTRKVIALVLGVCGLVAVVVVALSFAHSERLANEARLACIQQGGVWTEGTCGWSQPLGDREAIITVEEDGSYPAGCVAGRLCDDGGS